MGRIRMKEWASLPAGMYRLKVGKIQHKPAATYGPAWQVDFIVVAPQTHAGERHSELISDELRPGNKLARWIEAIIKIKLKPNDDFEMSELENKFVDAMVNERRDKEGNLVGNKIVDLYPVKDEDVNAGTPPAQTPPPQASPVQDPPQQLPSQTPTPAPVPQPGTGVQPNQTGQNRGKFSF